MTTTPQHPWVASVPSGVTAVYLREGSAGPAAGLLAGTRIAIGSEPGMVDIAPAHEPWDYRPDTLVMVVDGQLTDGLRTRQVGGSCDPFLYRIGTPLRVGFRRSLLPPPAYLASLVEPIADHLRTFYARRRASPRPAAGLSPQRLARVLEHIEAHLGERCPLEELAAVAHLSAFHFSRMFRRSTGHSPHAYMLARRLERGREMLADPDIPIAQVAWLVGFGTQSHFTNAFRRAFGIAPGGYRARGTLASISAREMD